MSSERVTVDLNELETGLEEESMGANAGNARVYVGLKTGKVHTVYDESFLEDLGVEAGIPEDVETSEEYVRLPDKKELGLGRELVFDFAKEHMPEDWNRVRDTFSRSGAYRRFKDLLERRGKLEAWHSFENARTEAALREWCAGHGLDVSGGRAASAG